MKLGIDIGHKFIKGLGLSKSEDGVSVESYFLYERKQTDTTENAQAELENFMKEMVEQCELQGAEVSVSLPYDQFTSFELTVPNIPQKDLEQIIQNKLVDQIKYGLGEASYAYLHVDQGPKDTGNAGMYKVYSSDKKNLLSISNTMSKAELVVAHLEPEPLSLTAALACNEFVDKESTHLVLDIGETQVTGFLVHKEKVLNVNPLDQNLGTLKNLLIDKMTMSPEEAEQEKRSFSFDADYAGNEIVQSLFDDFYCSLFDEVKRLAKLYSLQLQNQNIDSILITGGGSSCELIDQAMESYCHLPCFIVDPFRKVDFHSKGIETEFFDKNRQLMATALGLALRGVA